MNPRGAIVDRLALSAPAYAWYRMRSTQYDAIYVSPHMDDAVYSCGGQIALARSSGARVLIVTVFGHGASDERGAGVFRDYSVRKREEQAAAARLDVDHLWLNYPDLLVRPKRVSELARFALPFVSVGSVALLGPLAASLEALSARLLGPRGRVFFPLAIGAHPDHRVVFEAAQRVLARSALEHAFFEDVPYAQVPALREERLLYLGLGELPSARGALQAIGETTNFVFANAPAWQRQLAALVVGGHWLVTRALFRLLRSPARPPWALREQIIDDVVADKVAAMRAYQTQTDYFYPAGEAIYETLVRSGGHYVERCWSPRAGNQTSALQQPPVRSEREATWLTHELARVDALLVELTAATES